MKIAVIGAGYVGLVTAVGLTVGKHAVTCVDIDATKIKKLQSEIIPIFEEGLEKYLKIAVKNKLLTFSTDLENAVKTAEIIFIGVGTPELSSGAADLSSVFAAVKDIVRYADQKKIIVIKSTVPVGTAEELDKLIKKELKAQNKNFKIEIISNPEFLRQGKAINDFLFPERIVLGSKYPNAILKLRAVYRFIKTVYVITNHESAELIKYASNAFLATKISFINEIADLCEKTGGDVVEVATGMGLDARINQHFLNAGIGYGGSCFPKDTKALHYIARDYGNGFKLLEAVIEVNQQQKFRFLANAEKVLRGFKNKTIAILGLAFKGGTDDIRESVAVEICKHLLKDGAKVQVYDPQAMQRTKAVLPEIQYCQKAEEVAKNADALFILSDWPEFKKIDYQIIKKELKNPLIFDGKNLLDPNKMKKIGFRYYGVGR